MSYTKKLCVLFAFGVGAAFAADTPAAAALPIFRAESRADPAISLETLTNEGIVTLAGAGYSDAFIVQRILLSNRTRFDTSADALASMRRNAVSEELVLFMLKHQAQPSLRPEPVQPLTTLKKVQGKNIYVPIALPATGAPALAPSDSYPAYAGCPADAAAPVPVSSNRHWWK